jgi:hypothetical protein
MKEVKLYKKTWKGLKIFALTLPFIVIGIWMLIATESNSSDKIGGWFLILFFGLGIPVGLFQLLDKRPQIIIDENTIWDRTTNQDEIKWEQIQDAYPLDIYGQKFISLVVDDTFVFKQKQYKWALKINKAIGAQKLNLHLGQLKINENKMTAFIKEMMETEKGTRHIIIKKYFEK